jgi:membrane-associated HD superfamily phosphohydrolase
MTSQKNVVDYFFFLIFVLGVIHIVCKNIYSEKSKQQTKFWIDKIMVFTTVFVLEFRMIMMSDDDKHIDE